MTTAITPPTGRGLILGISTAFAVGAVNALERGAILEREVALHVAVRRPDSTNGASVSTQIAVLRRLLFGHVKKTDLMMEGEDVFNQTDTDHVHAFEKIREVS